MTGASITKITDTLRARCLWWRNEQQPFPDLAIRFARLWDMCARCTGGRGGANRWDVHSNKVQQSVAGSLLEIVSNDTRLLQNNHTHLYIGYNLAFYAGHVGSLILCVTKFLKKHFSGSCVILEIHYAANAAVSHFKLRCEIIICFDLING